MGVGRNESSVQTRPNQRYTYIPTGTTLSKRISLTATQAVEAASGGCGEKSEIASHFALDKKKAGRWAAHAKKADSLQLETYQYSNMEGLMRARWTPEMKQREQHN
jgi:hypothetical protein